MADRRLDNGKDEGRTAQHTGMPGNGNPSDTELARRGLDMSRRSPDTAPPGSRERSESDVSGYNPDRDEDPSMRQGRFHRAAQMRLAQPRTSSDPAVGAAMGMGSGMGMSGMGSGAGMSTRGMDSQQGPYGRDDRDERSATGLGSQMRMGEQEPSHALDTRRDTGGANYRTWDRTGYGAEERPLREERGQYSTGSSPYGHQGSYGQQGVQGQGRYDSMLGMGQASAGQPGTGVNMGRSEPSLSSRGPDTEPRRTGGTGLRGMFRRWQREPLTAREIMTRGVKTLRRDVSLREVAQVMKDEDCGVVPIVDDKGCLVGIVTDRDIVLRAFTGGKTPDQLRASDVMTDDVECVHPEENIHSIISVMGSKQVRRIPVVEKDDRVIGIISMGDIANRADYDEELQEALDRISSKRSFWSRLT